MSSAKSKFRFESAASRWGVCAVLVPFLILTGLSTDIQITHVHADGATHTHVSRVLAVSDAEHHCDHHGHEHRHDRDVPQHDAAQPAHDHRGEPMCCCSAEPVSTVIVNGAGDLIRQGRGVTRALDHDLNPGICGTIGAPATANAMPYRADPSRHPVLNFGRVMRRAVLLI